MKRRGFTLIELLVVVAVVGVLTSLLGPAVQLARSAAQATVCRSKLRDLSLALNQYLDVHSMYPGFMQRHALPPPPRTSGDLVYRVHTPSVLVQIMPYMGATELYDAVNFSRLGTGDAEFSFPGDLAANATVRVRKVGSLLCPADGGRGVSYRGCFGVGPALHRTREFPDSANGIFGPRGIEPVYPVTAADVSDGLSHTAAFSERPVGPMNQYGAVGITDADLVVRTCHAAAQLGVKTPGGGDWLYSGFQQTLYTHALPPNAEIEDCVDLGVTPPFGAVAARSHHGTSVNVAMGDGSARSISEGISLPVWRALATRDDGDAVGSQQ
jgi:prepilin-type N-terminal cleavage/methylation domain-containing protein